MSSGPRLVPTTRRSLLLLAATPLLFDSASAQERAGAVEDVRGEAFVEKEAKRRTLERAAPLFVKDLVTTGAASRATLKLGQSTSIKLGERARLVIDRYLMDAGGEIKLEGGAMLLDRPPGGAPVQVRSSFALIAVRGTRFFAGPSNNAFGVFVERGSVTVRGAGRSVTVRAGFGTDVARPGAAPTPPQAWGAPRIRAAMDSVG